VLKYLGDEQRTVVYNALNDDWPNIIKSGSDFTEALKYLNDEQRTAVCNALKDCFPEIIKNGSDFEGVLRVLNPEQRTAMYNAFKDYLPTIIKDDADCLDMCRYLSHAQRADANERYRNAQNNAPVFLMQSNLSGHKRLRSDPDSGGSDESVSNLESEEPMFKKKKSAKHQ